MKDYITHIPNRAAFYQECHDVFYAELPSDTESQEYIDLVNKKKLVSIDEDNNVAFLVAVCMVNYSSDNLKSVTIARLHGWQYETVLLLSSVGVIGESNELYIKQESDVSWKPYGKNKYLEVSPITPVKWTDEKGQEHEYTRPDVLTCVLA